MKLPGIQYGQVQQLGRHDIGAPLQVAQATSRAMSQWADVAADIYERQSVTQAEKALLNYDTTMGEWSQQQTPYQPDGTGTWVNGEKIYDEAEAQARQAAGKQAMTPMAQSIFERRVNEKNAKNRLKWGAQNAAWMREDELATAMTAADTYADRGDFEDARLTVARQVTVGNMSKSQGEKKIDEFNYRENYQGYSAQIEQVMFPDQGARVIDDIRADQSLTESDRNRLVAATEEKMLDNMTGDLFDQMAVLEETEGLAKAIEFGNEYFSEQRDVSADQHGSDEKFKLSKLYRIDQVVNTYRAKMVKKTSEGQRLIDVNRIKTGVDIASPSHNDKKYDDWYATEVLNWQLDGKSDYVRTTGETDIMTNPAIAARTVQFAADYGYMPSLAAKPLNAALVGQNGQLGSSAVGVYYGLYKARPTALYHRKQTDLLAIVGLADAMGGTDEAFQQAYARHQAVGNLSEQERDNLKQFSNSKVFKDEYDDNFNTIFEDTYQVDTEWYEFWRSSTPEVKNQHRITIENTTKAFLPYTNGDVPAAMRMAMSTMKESFGEYNGQFMKNAPKKFVNNGNVDGGDWMPNQLNGQIKQSRGEDYDTDFVRIKSVPNFNPDDPMYLVEDYNPDLGMVTNLGVWRFDYQETEQYKEQQKQLQVRNAAQIAERQRQRQAMEWEMMNSPESRKIMGGKRGIRLKQNPFGPVDRATHAEVMFRDAVGKNREFLEGLMGTVGGAARDIFEALDPRMTEEEMEQQYGPGGGRGIRGLRGRDQ